METAPMKPESSSSAKYLAEFLGTYMLVLTIGCNVLTGSPVWAVTSIACTLMVMIYALGNISGANFNPAVSLSLMMAGKLDPNEMGIYMCCQALGGVLAGLTYGISLWRVFNLAPTPGFEWYQAGLAELIYTFMLCFVVLNVCGSKSFPNQYFGLSIGFVVIAGGYGAGHISGGCFNPAVALGIDISSAGIGFGWSLVYIAFEFAGAALAAILFKVVRAHEFATDRDSKPKDGAILLSEFLGTYMLVLTVGLNVIGGSKAPVFSIAASLMCMIYALGAVSGGHFNPAVTLAIALTMRKKVFDYQKDTAKYMGAQFAGGICAGLTYVFLEAGKSFPLAPGKGYGFFQAGVAEIIFTFVLCYVVLCCGTTTKALGALDHYVGLVVGSCVTAGGYAIGAVSGGSLNPAVSFGIAAGHMLNGGGIINATLYTIFEFIGAALAYALFSSTHLVEDNRKREELDGIVGDN